MMSPHLPPPDRFYASYNLSVCTLGLAVTAKSVRARCLVCGRSFLAIRHSVKTCSAACRQSLSRERRAATPPLPEGPFDLFLADPPLHFRTYSEKGQGRSPSRHYPTMDLDWICGLPIKDLAAEDAGLALWVYGPLLPQAFDVMKSWGFEFKSDLITWEKTTASGTPAFGTGYYTRKSTEQLLYATRGRGLRRIDRGVPQCIRAPRQEHSRKPDEVFDALERLFGPVRRLELFARTRRPGWEAWGNEIAPTERLE
jgi:N6-adenosine-specific RNA methylase IME4